LTTTRLARPAKSPAVTTDRITTIDTTTITTDGTETKTGTPQLLMVQTAWLLPVPGSETVTEIATTSIDIGRAVTVTTEIGMERGTVIGTETETGPVPERGRNERHAGSGGAARRASVIWRWRRWLVSLTVALGLGRRVRIEWRLYLHPHQQPLAVRRLLPRCQDGRRRCPALPVTAHGYLEISIWTR
jgi:hypothetical protein